MDLKDWITSVAAILGALLGIYNFVNAIRSEKVMLKVVPKASTWRGRDGNGKDMYFHTQNEYNLDKENSVPDTLSIQIVNLSKFSVTVCEVGLNPKSRRGRMALAVPILSDDGSWPRKLEPRESILIFFDPTELISHERITSMTEAYASTVCGTTCYGSSGALKDFLRIAAAP